MLRYYATAALLGFGWFVVLQIPSGTREALVEDKVLHAVCLVAASVITAALCRRFIASADTFGQQLLRATVIPYAGCFVYLTLYAAQMWFSSLLHHGLANLHDTISLYSLGMLTAVFSFFVVIPYGLLCQYCMSAAERAWTGG